MQIGYKRSSEDHDAPTLVREARLAEERGFAFGMISDHYLPWTRDTPRQERRPGRHPLTAAAGQRRHHPRSSNAEHRQQNLNVFDFELSDDEMAQIGPAVDGPPGSLGLPERARPWTDLP